MALAGTAHHYLLYTYVCMQYKRWLVNQNRMINVENTKMERLAKKIFSLESFPYTVLLHKTSYKCYVHAHFIPKLNEYISENVLRSIGSVYPQHMYTGYLGAI